MKLPRLFNRDNWETKELSTVEDVCERLSELFKRKYLFRGHSRIINKLIPRIDRGKMFSLDRGTKLKIERKSIDIYRQYVSSFNSGEENAKNDDPITLMVLQHYDVPTRLLDWSLSPYIALFFAINSDYSKDAELWAFSHDDYAKKGAEQWKKYPETTTDKSGAADKFDYTLTTASSQNPSPWIVALFYPKGFPRQNAQNGLFTFTSEFSRDHAIEIKKLLSNTSLHQRFIIKSKLKSKLKELLKDKYDITKGKLFPDSAGAANTAKEEAFIGYRI